MKNIVKITISLFLIMTIFGCQSSCGTKKIPQKNMLRVGTNANYPPFESIDSAGVLIGFDIDLARELAKELGQEIEFKEFDFDALILALKNGQIDIAMSGLSITPSRKEEIAMVPYQGGGIKQVSFLFWDQIPANLNSFKDLAQLSKEPLKNISVQAGHFLQDFLTSENISVKALPGPPEQILDIKYKKSLAAALDFANASTLVKTHENLKILTFDLPEDKWDLGNGIGINKSRIDLIADIEKAVEKLRSAGTIEFLENKWLKGEK